MIDSLDRLTVGMELVGGVTEKVLKDPEFPSHTKTGQSYSAIILTV